MDLVEVLVWNIAGICRTHHFTVFFSPFFFHKTVMGTLCKSLLLQCTICTKHVKSSTVVDRLVKWGVIIKNPHSANIAQRTGGHVEGALHRHHNLIKNFTQTYSSLNNWVT